MQAAFDSLRRHASRWAFVLVLVVTPCVDPLMAKEKRKGLSAGKTAGIGALLGLALGSGIADVAAGAVPCNP